MYVIIREPCFVRSVELHKCVYGCVIYRYVEESIHPVVVVNKTFKIPIVKSLDTDYVVVLIYVLCPNGSIYIDSVVLTSVNRC
jgi:hypothetical protein